MMVDLTNWGPRQAIQHLVNDLEPYSGKQRDEQIVRAIEDFSERGKHERPDEATADRVTILADYFGVSEAYFWNPDVVEECDREVMGRHAVSVVRGRYLNGFRRIPGRPAPPSSMPHQWWTEDGMVTVNQILKDPALKPQIMEWFRDEAGLLDPAETTTGRP